MHKKTAHTAWIQTLSDWLDTKFTIPNTNIKYGLDPIFSLFPVLGDFFTYLVSLLIIITIKRNGASGELIMRMLINATIDVILGSIPIIGTIFDVAFKSNHRNMELLKAYYEEGKYQGSGKLLLYLVLIVIIGVLIMLTYLTYFLLWEMIQFIEKL